MDKEYIQSERFIHNELLARAATTVWRIPELWKEQKRIFPIILLWPTAQVKAQKGEWHTGVVFDTLPEEAAQRPAHIKQAAKKCNAYAVLVVEEVEGAVRAIFESEHGTETWRLPIKDHGGVRVLGIAARSSNTESVGVLWHDN